MVGEYDSAGTLLRRYVHGPLAGADDPIVWYEGAVMTNAALRHLYANQQGSIVLAADVSGGAARQFKFDEYGTPQTGQGGSLSPGQGARFLYTGQALIPELGMYYYKARMYSWVLGRFMQVDPIGYKDQNNLYAYVGNDPVDRTDPTGESWEDVGNFALGVGEIVVGTIIVGGGDGAAGAATAGTGGLAAPVAVPVAVAATTAGVGLIADGARRAGNALSGAIMENRRSQQTGSYTNTHESGRTYSGKGSQERSQESGRRVERQTGDRHTATDWRQSGSNREAFKAESRRIEQNGGPKSPENHNKIDSPGTKYRKIDGE